MTIFDYISAYTYKCTTYLHTNALAHNLPSNSLARTIFVSETCILIIFLSSYLLEHSRNYVRQYVTVARKYGSNSLGNTFFSMGLLEGMAEAYHLGGSCALGRWPPLPCAASSEMGSDADSTAPRRKGSPLPPRRSLPLDIPQAAQPEPVPRPPGRCAAPPQLALAPRRGLCPALNVLPFGLSPEGATNCSCNRCCAGLQIVVIPSI